MAFSLANKRAIRSPHKANLDRASSTLNRPHSARLSGRLEAPRALRRAGGPSLPTAPSTPSTKRRHLTHPTPYAHPAQAISASARATRAQVVDRGRSVRPCQRLLHQLSAPGRSSRTLSGQGLKSETYDEGAAPAVGAAPSARRFTGRAGLPRAAERERQPFGLAPPTRGPDVSRPNAASARARLASARLKRPNQGLGRHTLVAQETACPRSRGQWCATVAPSDLVAGHHRSWSAARNAQCAITAPKTLSYPPADASSTDDVPAGIAWSSLASLLTTGRSLDPDPILASLMQDGE